MILALLISSPVCSQGNQLISRQIPERLIPVPSTVSPLLQEMISAPLGKRVDRMHYEPRSEKEWARLIGMHSISVLRKVNELKKICSIQSIENYTIDGVNVFLVTPAVVSEKNQDKLLINIHGGGFVLGGGKASLPEAILGASYMQTRVLTIDYRMPPKYPFPAGLEDIITVYQNILNDYSADKIGIFGTSAGANLIAAAMFKLKEIELPLPAVIALGTPVGGLSKDSGDSHYTNELIDNNLVLWGSLMDRTFEMYADGHDYKNPLLSPIYGNFERFPPAILTAGTRDLFLSDTVLIYTKLRQAGTKAKLQVVEGLSHGQYLNLPLLPESDFIWKEIALFFDEHLY